MTVEGAHLHPALDFEDDAAEAHDARLAASAANGDRVALTALVQRHQPWVFSVALRFARDPDAAADLTQDALVRVVTRIAQFEGRSRFRTWAWQIVVRTFLNAKRSPSEVAIGGWDDYAAYLDATGLGDPTLVPDPLRDVLAEETRTQCTLGMLLCLDREQRLVLVLGAVLDVPAPAAAALFDWTPEQFRKRLERARRDLGRFVADQCGLVNPNNPCRCPKKTAAMVTRGLVDPARLRFVRRPTDEVPDARVRGATFAAFEASATDPIAPFRAFPDLPGPDIAGQLDALLQSAGLDGR